MINSSVNFIIYMVFNKQFADVYRRIFCECKFISTTHKRKSTEDILTTQTKTTRFMSATDKCEPIKADEIGLAEDKNNGSTCSYDDIHPRAKIVEIGVREDDPVESGIPTNQTRV